MHACRALDKGYDWKKVDCGLCGDTHKVLSSGDVTKEPGFKSIYEYLKDDLAAAEKARVKRDPAALAEVVCRRAAIRPLDALGASVKEAAKPETLADGTTILREVYSFGDGQKVPALTFLPKGEVKGAIIVLDDRPNRAIHRMRVPQALAEGCAIMVADVACTGETAGLRHSFYGMKNADEGPAVMLYLLGRSMVGMRAEELIALADSLKRRTGFACEVVPHGRPCIAAAHAFAARRDLFTRVQCLRSPESWAESVRKSSVVPFANVVNGALLDYDWTDLVK